MVFGNEYFIGWQVLNTISAAFWQKLPCADLRAFQNKTFLRRSHFQAKIETCGKGKCPPELMRGEAQY